MTIPHKTAALGFVGDGADRLSHQIGGLNTLVLANEEYRGFNTDCHAAVASLAGALGCSQMELGGLPVDVLGTGGAARAVVCGLSALGCRLTVYGKNPERTRELGRDFGARVAPWEERGRRQGDVLVNCTSLGMWPMVEASPMPRESLTGCRLVFDLIYNPLVTRLLEDARAAGCATLNGLDMFVRQATAQFELWTRCPPDTRDAADLIKRRIGGPVQDAVPATESNDPSRNFEREVSQ